MHVIQADEGFSTSRYVIRLQKYKLVIYIYKWLNFIYFQFVVETFLIFLWFDSDSGNFEAFLMQMLTDYPALPTSTRTGLNNLSNFTTRSLFTQSKSMKVLSRSFQIKDSSKKLLKIKMRFLSVRRVEYCPVIGLDQVTPMHIIMQILILTFAVRCSLLTVHCPP